MDLTKLFEMQKVLDARIEKEHPQLQGEDRLAKKILALQVELGELANELPGTFKFWSNKKNDYKKALVEYVDCLHFILSIGLEFKYSSYSYATEEKISLATKDTMTNIQNCFYEMSFLNKFRAYQYYHSLLIELLALGRSLGFTGEQIEHAYLNKNKINHERQQNGY